MQHTTSHVFLFSLISLFALTCSTPISYDSNHNIASLPSELKPDENILTPVAASKREAKLAKLNQEWQLMSEEEMDYYEDLIMKVHLKHGHRVSKTKPSSRGTDDTDDYADVDYIEKKHTSSFKSHKHRRS